jgi:hypothetical protein
MLAIERIRTTGSRTDTQGQAYYTYEQCATGVLWITCKHTLSFTAQRAAG